LAEKLLAIDPINIIAITISFISQLDTGKSLKEVVHELKIKDRFSQPS
jgi:hypothetical protein